MDSHISDSLASGVVLRDVIENDLAEFYEHQRDPEATQMAAFPAREQNVFMAHWTKILRDETSLKKTILSDGRVAGNIVSWQEGDDQLIGYWLGKEFWGKGIATKALSEFVDQVKIRPLYAHVVKHNIASRRVLEKCGFIISGETHADSGEGDEAIDEIILKLDDA